jgi:hypothetical protein
MTKAPPTGSKRAKTVDGKEYFWCPKHKARGRHEPKDCKGVGINGKKATGVEFDARFLSFAPAPDGSSTGEKIVWCIGKNSHDIFFDSREATMEEILDLPKRCRESLYRVGQIH